MFLGKGVWVIRPPAAGPHIQSSAPSPYKNFNQLNLFLFEGQSLWSCALYFQWFTDHLNHVYLLTLYVAACFKETALLFNVHLSCFLDYFLCLTNKYIFKVNNKKIILICWMCSKLKINTAWHSSGVFVVDFDHSQHINIVFLLLSLNKYLSVGCERQVIMFWKHNKQYIFFAIKVTTPISFSNLSLHWIEINYEKMTVLWTYYEHNMNIYFSSKLALGILSVLSSFRPVFWSALSSLFSRYLIFFCCIKPKTYLNQRNGETNW